MKLYSIALIAFAVFLTSPRATGEEPLDPRFAEAVEQMLQEVNHPDPRMRASHAETFGSFPEAVHFLDRLVPALLQLRTDSVPTVREKAILSLLRLVEDLEPNPQVDAALSAAIHDESPAVRRLGVRALARFERGQVEACKVLRQALGDKDPTVRATALRVGMDLLEWADLALALEGAIHDSDPRVRRQAMATTVAVFGKVGKERQQLLTLLQALNDPEPAVRNTAFEGLLNLLPQAPPQASHRAFHHDSTNGRGLAVKLFSQLVDIWPSEVGKGESHPLEPLLVATLKGASAEERTWAAAAVSELNLGSKNSIQALKEAMQDPLPEIRSAAVLTLAELKPKSTAIQRTLVQTMVDPVPEIATQAALALLRTGVEDPELRARILVMLPDLVPTAVKYAGEILLGSECGGTSPAKIRAQLAEQERAKTPGQLPKFLVVVNQNHSETEIGRKTLSKIFLRKITRWPEGQAVTPVDLHRCSSVREGFSRRVHGKPAKAIVSYWQRMIFSRGVPPMELDLDQEVLRFLRQNPNGIGYVSVETKLGDGIQALSVTD